MKLWGTTREPEEIGLEQIAGDSETADIRYWFLTAWSPPDSWVTAISQQSPNLEFVLTFAEPGMAFAGEITGEGGRVIDEEWNEVDAAQELAQRGFGTWSTWFTHPASQLGDAQA